MNPSIVLVLALAAIAAGHVLPVHDSIHVQDHSNLGHSDIDVDSSSYVHGYYPHSISGHYGGGYLHDNVWNQVGDYYGYQTYGYPHYGPHYYGSSYGYPYHGSSHYYSGLHGYGHGYPHVY